MSIPKFKIFLHFILFLLPNIICDKDLYKILEIKRDATQNEIKHKYRQLSRIYHPDKNRSPEAAEKYKEINEAYEILSDTKKRRLYDRGGMDAVNRDGQMEGHDPFDIFDIFTGGAHRRARQDRNRGEDMRVKVRASLKDLYMGKEYEFTYTRYAMCPHCRGSGADSYEDVETCDKCNGQGVYMETKRLGPGFIQQIQKTCPKCGGRGKMIKKECHECHGKKIVQSLEEMTLFIEKGMENGSEIKFEEFGEEKPDKDPGHLIFIVEELPDKVFKREKDNLRVDMVISLKEALIGFNREIIHLDGHKVPIKKNTVSQPGEVIRIKKEGMPIHNKGDSGDLLVTLKIKFPDKLTEQQKDKLYQFFNKRSYW
jgi:DnaJ-related protein SCJ1